MAKSTIDTEIVCPACGNRWTFKKPKTAKKAEFKCSKCETYFHLTWPEDEPEIARRFRMGEDF